MATIKNRLKMDELIQEFMQKFYGYGSYSNDYWFIGIEEGGGKSKKEIIQRLNVWEQRKKKGIERIRPYHNKIKNLLPKKDQEDWFCNHPKIQPTWGPLIRIMLNIQGNKCFDNNDIRRIQSNGLQGMTLLELRPLPSKNIKTWQYQKWFPKVEFLKKRKDYNNFIDKTRKSHLYNMIQNHKPKVVIFYGLGFMPEWGFALGFKEIKVGKHRFNYSHFGQTIIVSMVHPTAASYKYCNEIGNKIREQLKT